MTCSHVGCSRAARRYSPLCAEHFEALLYGPRPSPAAAGNSGTTPRRQPEAPNGRGVSVAPADERDGARVEPAGRHPVDPAGLSELELRFAHGDR